MKNHALLAAAVLLTACGGGSGGNDAVGSPASACTFVPGQITWSEVAGNTPQDLEKAADGDLESFGSIGDVCCGQGSLIISDRVSGQQFPAGTKAGIYLSLPDGTTTGNIAISTLLNGVVQDSAAGATLGDVQDPQHSPAADYLFVNTTQSFDEIELSITGSVTGLTGEILLFEFCADATE